ncbi:hypothetical protein HAX54_003081 [Datura stramonium]|uniref:Uncharacterized protein n=1 Tax=Datura stramonium TaxID=4076 RepID=A0ABS8RT75_DATST|nr:hypothetical protein [Datura stramonium]
MEITQHRRHPRKVVLSSHYQKALTIGPTQTQSCGLYLWSCPTIVPHLLHRHRHRYRYRYRHRCANDKLSGGADTHLPLPEDLNSGACVRESVRFFLSGKVCPFFSENISTSGMGYTPLVGTSCPTGIFIAAAITDWLDGYLARKMNLGTAFGAFFRSVADKLMVAATLILLCTRPLEASVFGQLPWLPSIPSIAIIGREITMSAVREWAASQGGKLSEAVAVNNLGKWKTATQMIALTILLLTRDSNLSGAGTVVASGVILLYVQHGWLYGLWWYMKVSKVLLM